MNRTRLLTLVLVLVMVLVAAAGAVSTRAQDEPLKITFVINGNLGDQSFFDSAQRGMDRLLDEGLNVEINTIELGTDPANWESGLSDAMVDTDNYDLLITGTSQMPQFLATRVHQYPDKVFIFYDDKVPYDDPDICVDGCANVLSILFAQNEGSFLAGVYAQAITQSGLEGTNPDLIIGAVGGMDMPVINDFIVGYKQGACLVNPDSQLIVQYAGGWNDAAKGKEISLAMYEQKADIVFQVAGQTGVGVFEAAQEQNRYAIGVDSDQGSLIEKNDPDQAQHILTSMLKNVDLSLYLAVVRHMAGEVTYGQAEMYGVADGVVGLAYNDIYFDNTPENILDLIDAAEEALLRGEITVTTVYEDHVEIGGYSLASVDMSCDEMPETDFDAGMYLQ